MRAFNALVYRREKLRLVEEGIQLQEKAEQQVRRLVEQNPDIAVIRKNRGIAAAGVVIARTYPFNPVWQSYVWGDNGPKIAFVTNHVAVAQTMITEPKIHLKDRRSAPPAGIAGIGRGGRDS